MEVQELKTKLLNTHYFIDNEYLDKYCNLIIDNLDTKKEQYKTESHHILQVSYFKVAGIDVDNSNNNRVNLLYKNHVLAHQCLIFCTTNELKDSNILAFRCMADKYNYWEDLTEEQLEDLQGIRNTWIRTYLDKRGFESFQDLLDRISYADLFNYLILEKHRLVEAYEKFNLNCRSIQKILKFYGINIKNYYKSVAENISKEDIINYWVVENHTFKECLDHFGINHANFKKLLKNFNIIKFSPRKLPKSNVLDDLKSLNIEEIKHYYIDQNNSQKDTIKHFNMKPYTLSYLIDNKILYKGKNKKGKNKDKIINYSELYDYYIVQYHTKKDTATYFGVCLETLNKNLIEYSLPLEFSSLEKNIKKISYNSLYSYYIEKNNGLEATKDHFHVSTESLKELLNYYQIVKENKKLPTYEELYDYYIVKNNSYGNCLKKFNLTGQELNKLLIKYDINKRNISKIDINILYNMYVVDKISVKEIANFFNVSESKIYKILISKEYKKLSL